MQNHVLSKQPVPRISGFTLIEILVVIGMIAILSATVLVAVNPLRQFGQARNAQRMSNVAALLNAVGNRIADNNGIFESSTCTDIPSSPKNIASADGLDIRNCLVPTYISELPYDPTNGSNTCTDGQTSCAYSTGYTISVSSTSKRVTICAPNAVDDGMTSPYCLTR